MAPESLHADLLTGQGPSGGRWAPRSPRKHRLSPALSRLRILLLPAGSGMGVSSNERSFEGLLQSALSHKVFLPLECSSVLISRLEPPGSALHWPEDGAEEKHAPLGSSWAKPYARLPASERDLSCQRRDGCRKHPGHNVPVTTCASGRKTLGEWRGGGPVSLGSLYLELCEAAYGVQAWLRSSDG